MGGVRVRWQSALKFAAVAAAAGLALQLLPHLLEPPKPPPLAADVGLPPIEGPAPSEPAAGPARERAPGIDLGPAKAVIGSQPRRRLPRARPRKAPARPPAPPPPPPVPVQAPPEPSPPTPPAGQPTGDGSEEFAPTG